MQYFYSHILNPNSAGPPEIDQFIGLITHDEEFFSIARAIIPALGLSQGYETALFNPQIQRLLRETEAWRQLPPPPLILTDPAKAMARLRKRNDPEARRDAVQR